jgi:hypothetical protein
MTFVYLVIKFHVPKRQKQTKNHQKIRCQRR